MNSMMSDIKMIKIVAIFGGCLLFCATCVTEVSAASKGDLVPNSYIVELESPPTATFRGFQDARVEQSSSGDTKDLRATSIAVTGRSRLDVSSPEVKAYAAYLDENRSQVVRRAAQRFGRDIEPRAVFRHVLNGFTAELSAGEAEALAKIPGVKSVHQDRYYRLHLDQGPRLVGAENLWNAAAGGTTRGEGVVIGVIDSGINWDHRYFSDDPSNTGGYVHENPLGTQLGECSKPTVRCNDKLIGVYNFADEGTDGKDPDENGHGSHVASIAVGNPWTFSLQDVAGFQFGTSGVAPRANVISYKVCFTDHPTNDDLDGKCEGDATLRALEQAIEDGVDVINFSIGDVVERNPWTEPQLREFLNVRAAGILVVTSAGNEGPGRGSIGSPANAPWMFSIGSSTHRRRLGNEAEIAGLNGIFVVPGTGPQLTIDISAPVIAVDTVGEDLTGCEPFPPGSFANAIAFLRRGDCFFETKVNNAEDAGAVAVLVFNNVPGLPITMAGLESTVIPAAMMDIAQGELALGSIRQSDQPTATLFRNRSAILNPDWEDQISTFSSRGPTEIPSGIMKPNVVAPGDSIIAAGVPDQNSLAILSGTSMASPHVAGAVALLKSLHPDWSPDILQSVLETTAESGPVEVNGTPASILDRGAGRINVAKAVSAGLYLPVSEAEFLDANPASSGDPRKLNLSGLIDPNCVGTCTFERTVRALRAGTWDVSVEAGPKNLEIDVSPRFFTLEEGETELLQIKIVASTNANLGWNSAGIVLAPRGSELSVQRLPVGANLIANSQTNRGRATLNIDDAPVTDELVLRTSGLRRPVERELQLEPDPTSSDPFDDSTGVFTELIDVPDHAFSLEAETFDSQAQDVDLFLGRDDNGDGLAQESEIRCESISLDDLERCSIRFPEQGTWWVHVQNWVPSGPTVSGTDKIPLDYLLLAEEVDPSLVGIAPGAHPGGALPVQIFWDQPRMLEGETWKAVIGIASSLDSTADIDVVEFDVVRTGDNAPAETALFEGQAYPVVLPSNATHNLLYIDVPPGMAELNVDVEGAVSNVTIRRRDFDELAATVPNTPPAPDQVLVQATQNGDQWNASLQDPQGGRYFVVLENAGSEETDLVVTASVAEPQTGTPPPGSETTRRGLWGPAERDNKIRQGLDWQAGGGGRFAVWYTYDEAGLPTFYITDTVPEDGSSFFSAVLFRATSDDARSSLKVVGEVQVTRIRQQRFMYAWRLNGNHGAEMFSPVSGSTCPTIPELGDEPVPLLGHWFSPDTTAGGATLLITGSAEAWIRYYYDNSNAPRWVLADEELGSTLPGGSLMEVLDYRGFCIYCDEVTPTSDAVGTLERQFIDEGTVREISDFVAGPPLNSSIDIDREIILLSNPINCAN